jgi:hypothetical protein
MMRCFEISPEDDGAANDDKGGKRTEKAGRNAGP